VRHQLLTSRLTIGGHGDVTVGIRGSRFSTFSSVSSLVLATMAEAAQWDEAHWELVMKKLSCLVQKVESLVGGQADLAAAVAQQAAEDLPVLPQFVRSTGNTTAPVFDEGHVFDDELPIDFGS
jgi:hypothetical protein